MSRRQVVGKRPGLRATICTVILMTLPLVWQTIFTSSLSAQQKRDQQPDQPITRSSSHEPGAVGVLADSAKDYLISPGDVIEIKVEDAPELSYQYRVTAAGYIEMKVLGRVLARQKTTYALARQIEGGLREQEYLKSPSVLVTVTQYNSRTFFIQGAVQRPGLYQVEGNPSLITLISLAGGLTDNHGSTAMVLRPKNTGEFVPAPEAAVVNSKMEKPGNVQPQQNGPEGAADYDLIKVNLSGLYKGQFDQNQKLEAGDIINIPRADVFFVGGEVKAPGSFVLKDGTTLSQAISLAQGTTFKAKPSHGLIFREDPATGKRQEIKVDIGAVMKGRREDLPVRANDVIIVPNSKGKAVGGAILMTLGTNVMRFPIP